MDFRETLDFPLEQITFVSGLQFAEERLRDPTPAVVGSEFVVHNDQHAALRLLDTHHAVRYQNAEVGHGGFGPIAKARSNLPLTLRVDSIEFPVLG